MIFKLSLKNIASRPLRAVATVIAIAAAAAIIFAMLSFKPAVYDYISSTSKAISGDSDIVISTNSSSSRITEVTPKLENLDGVERVTPILSLYALLGDEYVKICGFEKGHICDLQGIKLTNGSYANLQGGVNEDNIIISKSAAKHFGKGVGDEISLRLGERTKKFIVEGVAENEGYFLADAPYLIVGDMRQVSTLITDIALNYCNEIYVKAAAGVNVDELVKQISSIDDYSSMFVRRTDEDGYIGEQVNSLAAPVILAGAAVLMLGVAVIVLLNMMSAGEKTALSSKYAVIGATKSQIFGIFMLESVLLAFSGAVIGSGLSVGIFALLIKLTLKGATLSVSALRLFGGTAIGFLTGLISAAIPILRSFGRTARQNQVGVKKNPLALIIVCAVSALLAIVCVVLEFTLSKGAAVVSLLSLIFSFAALGTGIAFALKGGAHLTSKSGNPAVKVASLGLKREGRFARAVVMLGLGMTVTMLLFMAWYLTKTIFSSYVDDFRNMVFVTNFHSEASIDDFKSVDGVEDAMKIVWKQGELKGNKFDKTMNILGTSRALDIVDFAYITPKEQVESKLGGNEPYVFLDVALEKLYGVGVGDTLALSVDGVEKNVVVGGILEHRLFSGNYVIVSDAVLNDLFDVHPDTILALTSGNTENVVGALRARFAKNNYYAVSVLTAYQWDMKSTDAVFDLVGTLAVVVALFSFGITAFAALVGRGGSEKDRRALLCVGMSKSSLLSAEVFQHALVAIVALVISYAISVLLTSSLIHALMLFGLYFSFMYNPWVTLIVGVTMAAAYTLLPVAFAFKKGYNIKRR